jgi:hypothetical protein
MRLVFGPDCAPLIPMLLSLSERAALTAFLRGRPCGKRSGHAMARAGYFPSRRQAHPIAQSATGAPRSALYIARQNSRLPPSSALLRPLRCAPRCRSGPPAAFRRHEGRDERDRSDEGKPP